MRNFIVKEKEAKERRRGLSSKEKENEQINQARVRPQTLDAKQAGPSREWGKTEFYPCMLFTFFYTYAACTD
jgi:hypothetical protein